MVKETKAPELNSQTALQEKMYRMGYEDAENKREYGESIRQETNKSTYNNQEMEQLTLF